jgi:hypothetical protein
MKIESPHYEDNDIPANHLHRQEHLSNKYKSADFRKVHFLRYTVPTTRLIPSPRIAQKAQRASIVGCDPTINVLRALGSWIIG